jgi:hypothetical protein
MIDYVFGAGGFKLGERVEILMTGQRGVLINETIHISGCNTYQILLPNVLKDGIMKTTNRDYLMLRKLETGESMFVQKKELTEDNSYSPKSDELGAEWIRAAICEQKEYIPEIDEAEGVEEIAIMPGMEVFNKIYGKIMMISHIIRDVYSKELLYGAVYMTDDKEDYALFHRYAFVPLKQKLQVPPIDKRGPIFDDSRTSIEVSSFGRKLKIPENVTYGFQVR